MPQSVVFYLPHFNSGGTEWFALRLARGLKKQGFNPLFLVINPKGELRDMIMAEFDVVPLEGAGYSCWGVFRTFPATMRFLRKRKPAVLIGGLPLLNVALALCVRLAHVDTQLILVEHMRLLARKKLRWSPKQWLKRRLLCFAYHFADASVSVSRTAAGDLVCSSHFAEIANQTIYNPVIPDDFDALCQETPPHEWLRHKTKPVLVAIGRLLPVKDYGTLLEAFAALRVKRDVRLVIFGEGHQRHFLEKKVRALGLEPHVSLPGSVPNVFSALRACDLFVLSSLSEAFGNVVVEALACSAPVVCTDCGGPREILEDGRYGILVPIKDSVRLAEAMAQALDADIDPDVLRARGLFFSVDRAVASYADLIRRLL